MLCLAPKQQPKIPHEGGVNQVPFQLSYPKGVPIDCPRCKAQFMTMPYCKAKVKATKGKLDSKARFMHDMISVHECGEAVACRCYLCAASLPVCQPQ